MPPIPSLTARQVIRALEKAGFIKDRQKGSHAVFIHPLTQARTVVPVHPGKSLKKALIRAIIHDTQISIDEFLELL